MHHQYALANTFENTACPEHRQNGCYDATKETSPPIKSDIIFLRKGHQKGETRPYLLMNKSDDEYTLSDIGTN